MSETQEKAEKGALAQGKVLTPAAQRALAEAAARREAAKPLDLPPDVPAARLEALRTAFAASLADPALLAEAKKENLEIHPLGVKEIVDTIKQVDATTPAVIERAKPMFGVGAK